MSKHHSKAANVFGMRMFGTVIIAEGFRNMSVLKRAKYRKRLVGTNLRGKVGQMNA
jgi:hypothetical protein